MCVMTAVFDMLVTLFVVQVCWNAVFVPEQHKSLWGVSKNSTSVGSVQLVRNAADFSVNSSFAQQSYAVQQLLVASCKATLRWIVFLKLNGFPLWSCVALIVFCCRCRRTLWRAR